MKNIVTSGKRKTSIARAKIKEGVGKVSINNKNYKTINFFDKLKIEEPLRISEAFVGKNNFDVVIDVKGGPPARIKGCFLPTANA